MLAQLRGAFQKWKAYKAHLKANHQMLYFFVDNGEALLVALVAALIFRQFVLQVSVVPTGSMIPTMMIGDRLLVDKLSYRYIDPSRGDIVVFKSPFKDGKDYVKRCVGLPGETLEVIRGDVYINGKLMPFAGVNVQNDFAFFGPIQIPTGNYFMMGDNRGNSLDSRYWGFVPRKDIVGRGLFTFWPISRMQPLR